MVVASPVHDGSRFRRPTRRTVGRDVNFLCRPLEAAIPLAAAQVAACAQACERATCVAVMWRRSSPSGHCVGASREGVGLRYGRTCRIPHVSRQHGDGPWLHATRTRGYRFRPRTISGMKVTHGQLVVARVGRFVWPLLVAGMIVALIIGWPPSTSNWITSGLIGISAILGIINSTIVVRRFRRENDEGSRPSSPQ